MNPLLIKDIENYDIKFDTIHLVFCKLGTDHYKGETNMRGKMYPLVPFFILRSGQLYMSVKNEGDYTAKIKQGFLHT